MAESDVVIRSMRPEDGKFIEIRGHYADTTQLDAFWKAATDTWL